MNHRFPLIRFTVALAILALPLAAFAGDPVGRATGGGSSIEWMTTVSGHDKIVLTVSGPDDVYTKEFSNGKNVSFRLSDLGTTVSDGVYQYELRVVPKISSDVAKKLEKARAANDEKAAKAILKAAGVSEVVQSGAFTIRNGSFVSPDLVEEGAGNASALTSTPSAGTRGPGAGKVAVNDQVIPDDLIVQGSACVGLDCVNNESFGFDTIRLKENNTRIKFDDTSVSAGFPANDWQLTANDSASGGSSKFSIEDITGSKVPFTITAGASTNSIFADSTGRIGFRTSTPVLDLHVNTSNTPAIRLEQNNSGGFTAQTWDIGANEANFFVRDVTGGSKLSLRIRPGAPTSSVDISADGDVGVGTASPESKLHVFGDNTSDTFVGIGPNPDGSPGTESGVTFGYAGSSFGRGAGFINVRPDSGATAPNPSLRLAANNTVRILIDNNGEIGLGTIASTGANPDAPIQWSNGVNTARLSSTGVWQDSSSRKAKEHIENLTSEAAFKALKELQPVTYNYKVLPSDGKVGFIAEDVPDLVATPERDGLSALDIVAVVTKVVQDQQKTIEQLNARIAELEKEKQQKQ